ncbi:hypothetical protein TeGR_g185 [Tetraparma gracilis]|uniref:NADH dehydrogenase subunit 6 n=1 Tax=Tetraparma gracilis TaxID=2962635 RepID=A0ABQ6N271_9STRA|nr:hypothetical protein TeGR_g185 [Tetraparma gracilis]
MLVSVALTAVLWEPLFTLGAYGTIFFSTLFTVAFVSLALFLGLLLSGTRPRFHPWSTAALVVFPAYLLSPTFLLHTKATLWLVLDIVMFLGSGSLVAILLVRLFFPQTADLRGGRELFEVLGSVLPVLALSFVAGFFQTAFVDCDSIEAAGWSTSQLIINCTTVPSR